MHTTTILGPKPSWCCCSHSKLSPYHRCHITGRWYNHSSEWLYDHSTNDCPHLFTIIAEWLYSLLTTTIPLVQSYTLLSQLQAVHLLNCISLSHHRSCLTNLSKISSSVTAKIILLLLSLLIHLCLSIALPSLATQESVDRKTCAKHVRSYTLRLTQER